jgi:catechol 2,3-dioxygenase-like lactoylglutathione lyase family enzyme
MPWVTRECRRRWCQTQTMAADARLSIVVIYVSDLDASVTFYTELLGLKVSDRQPTAALLASAARSPLILRSMGADATRAPGSVGVHFVVWAAATDKELDRVERMLKARSAYVETRRGDGYTMVEGRDPDDNPVLVAYPAPDEVPLHTVPVRVYAW